MQAAQVAMLAGETAELPYIERYGFTSCPKPGAEGVALFFDGDRSHGVILCLADRRYRLTSLKSGEVALYDDIGQSVLLGKDGITIRGAGKKMTFTDTPEMIFETPLASFAGNVVAQGEIMDQGGKKSMSGMRATYNNHTHDETQSVTSVPNQEM
ncbi:MAG: phage baseplate assembly protein V [Oxalobacter formigenes]|nr:phage baseplate assembly protein V [Oxalobacter formigenes]